MRHSATAGYHNVYSYDRNRNERCLIDELGLKNWYRFEKLVKLSEANQTIDTSLLNTAFLLNVVFFYDIIITSPMSTYSTLFL